MKLSRVIIKNDVCFYVNQGPVVQSMIKLIQNKLVSTLNPESSQSKISVKYFFIFLF